MISSLLTAVYNPKAFIPHAASLGQAFAHCRRFSTAATRRCLGSVSVPVRRATLSRPLCIVALVGRYPTNKLVQRSPLPGRNHTFDPHLMKDTDVIRHYLQFPAAIPDPGVCNYALLSLSPLSILEINRSVKLKLLARLACLIHAANVHSEPGSNPSIRSLN